MDWNVYQAFVNSMWKCPQNHDVTVAIAGLAGELGELTTAVLNESSTDIIEKELGDFLFYVTICHQLENGYIGDVIAPEPVIFDYGDEVETEQSMLLNLVMFVGAYCEMVKKNITYTERKYNTKHVEEAVRQILTDLARLSNVYGLTLQRVAQTNVKKLEQRLKDNTVLRSDGRKD